MVSWMHEQLPLLAALVTEEGSVREEALQHDRLKRVLDAYRTGSLSGAAKRAGITVTGMTYGYERTIRLLREDGYHEAASMMRNRVS